MKMLIPILMLLLFFGFMILIILWARRAAKNFKKEGKVSSIDKLRKLQ